MKPLETERLILREFRSSDKDDLFEIFSDAQTVAFEPYLPADETTIQSFVEERVNNEEFIAVQCAQTGQVIGNIYLGKRENGTLELGYVFGRSFWKKGYAAEACEALIQDAFKKGIHRIYAQCDPQNSNSWHLLERLGFIKEAYLKKNVSFFNDENGQPILKDTFVYSLLCQGGAKNIQIDEQIRLIPYYPNIDVTFAWYQDAQSCLQSDRIGKPYTVSRIGAMYNYLCKNGDCYYIEYEGELCGDITLKNDGEICIFIAKEYQNRHIGRRCVEKIIQLAKEKGMKSVIANIYEFNVQSRTMFETLGFERFEKEMYRKEC